MQISFFTSVSILIHVDLQEPFSTEADPSDFALGSILLQQGDDGKLHSMAFHSCKFDAIEINYDVHNRVISYGLFL